MCCSVQTGSGGMGVVYGAIQESLGAAWALRTLPKHQLGDATRLERFRREARAAARLHHTHIVPVFGVGEEDGVHYYIMQFIRGQGLDSVLREVKRLRRDLGSGGKPNQSISPGLSATLAIGLSTGKYQSNRPPSESALNAGATEACVDLAHWPQAAWLPLCRSRVINRSCLLNQRASTSAAWHGLGFKLQRHSGMPHGQGILHRDIKPSNLLLDAKGEVTRSPVSGWPRTRAATS